MLSNALDLFPQALHHGALAYGFLGARRTPPQSHILTLQFVGFQGSFDRQQQFGQRQGFFQKIISAKAGRLHGGLHRTMPRHHDHGRRQTVSLHPFLEQRYAIHIGHPYIEQHQVRTAIPQRLAG